MVRFDPHALFQIERRGIEREWVELTLRDYATTRSQTELFLDTRLRGYDGYFVIPAEAGIQEKCNLCLPRSGVSWGTYAVYDEMEVRGDKRSFLRCFQERGKKLRVVTRADDPNYVITTYFDRRKPCA